MALREFLSDGRASGPLANVRRAWEINHMQVSIHQGQTLIGIATLEHLDPPMGVAFGPFSPSNGYDRDKHANAVDGDYVGDRGQSLSVCHDQHGLLKTASIAIEDWADPEIGKHLTVWFQDGRDFAAYFSAHDDFKAYYSL
jgi:hypothetical protein